MTTDDRLASKGVEPRAKKHVQLWLLMTGLLLAPMLGGATCGNRRDDRAREQAVIHYDLGVQAMQNNDSRQALVEYQKAVELDPDFDLAHQALGLVYHLSFGDLGQAIIHYQQALRINPKLSEGYTNLGNAYLDSKRYDEAMAQYEKALADILYRTPYIAENNLGWCYYKKGQVQAAIDHIKSALVVNPNFCLGHRNLGLIFDETRQPAKAVAAFGLYAKHCPDVADAHYRYARALMANGDTTGARRELGLCVEYGKTQTLGDDCQRLLNESEK